MPKKVAGLISQLGSIKLKSKENEEKSQYVRVDAYVPVCVYPHMYAHHIKAFVIRHADRQKG